MLRRLRKKLELIEIWGWCPRPTKENLKGAEIPFSDDSWSKVDTILELRDPNRYRVCRNGSLRSLDGFGWFLVQFQTLISYFRIFGNFEYKSYVDFDEIWCGSLIDTILSSNWNWWFSTWGPRTGRDELSYGWLIEFMLCSETFPHRD